jgi:hypothetical protein
MGIVEIALTGSLVLVGISLLLIVIFGIKNIASGKHEWSKIAIVAAPFIIFGGTYGVTGEMTESGLITFLVLMAVMLLLILFGGLRSSFKF